MKKTVLTASFLGIIGSAFQVYAYIPEHVSRFKDQKDCVQCNLTNTSFGSWQNTEKTGGKFDGSFFTNTTVKNYKIIDASFAKTNFVKSDIDRTEFTNSVFRNANLSYSSWLDVAFIKSEFKDVNFSHISLRGSFSSCYFNNIDFTESVLSDVSFSRAKMINTDFTGAKLQNADFSRVSAENISLKNADMSHAILIGSNITIEQLSKAKTYKCATLPNGEVYTNNGEYNCK